MDLDELKRVVSEIAGREPSVLAAWIFGSRARSEERPGSDVDVALLTIGEARTPAIEDRIAREVAERTSLDIDVCRLEAAGPVLALEIVAEGLRVFTRDEERVDAAEERVRRTYLDTAHLRRVQHHYLYGDPL